MPGYPMRDSNPFGEFETPELKPRVVGPGDTPSPLKGWANEFEDDGVGTEMRSLFRGRGGGRVVGYQRPGNQLFEDFNADFPMGGSDGVVLEPAEVGSRLAPFTGVEAPPVAAEGAQVVRTLAEAGLDVEAFAEGGGQAAIASAGATLVPVLAPPAGLLFAGVCPTCPNGSLKSWNALPPESSKFAAVFL